MTRAMPQKSPTLYIPGLTAAKRHALVTAATRAVDTKARRGRQPQHSYFCAQPQGQREVAEAGGLGMYGEYRYDESLPITEGSSLTVA